MIYRLTYEDFQWYVELQEKSSFRLDTYEYRIQGWLHDFVRSTDLTSPYKGEAKTIKVAVHRQKIVDHQLVYQPVTTYDVPLPKEKPTQAEYLEDLNIILDELPTEQLKRFVREEAWDRGHSSGYVSVLAEARELVDSLQNNGVTK